MERESSSGRSASAPEVPVASMARFIGAPVQKVSLDDIDRQILDALREDGRLSQRALAQSVPLSPPAIGERVARLERLGVIRGYSARIGWAEAGYPMVAHLAISVGAGADLASIVDALGEIPELIELHIVTGQWDVLGRFRIADQASLQNLLLGRVWQIPGIQRVETNLELASIEGRSSLFTSPTESRAEESGT